jgi:hypothetical protein
MTSCDLETHDAISQESNHLRDYAEENYKNLQRIEAFKPQSSMKLEGNSRERTVVLFVDVQKPAALFKIVIYKELNSANQPQRKPQSP